MGSRLSADERRKQLVAAGLSIAARNGLATVTTRAVAEEAQVSLGTVHYCFENMDALLSAMIENIITVMTTGVRDILASATIAEDHVGVDALRELMHIGLRSLWQSIEATPDVQLLTYEATTYGLRQRADSTPRLAQTQYAITEKDALEILTAAASATNTTFTQPVEFIVRFAMSMIDGVSLRWLVDRDGAAALAQMEELAGFIASKAVAD